MTRTRSAVAVLSVIISLVIGLALRPLVDPVPLLIFIPAVALSACYGGARPGLLALVLSALAGDYFLLAPHDAFTLDGAALVQIGLFALAALLVCWFQARTPADEPLLRAALSVENVRLSGEVQLARRDAGQAIERITRSQAVTNGLSEALSIAQVADVILAQGLPAVNAAAGSVRLLARDGVTLELVKATGYPDAQTESWQRYPIDTPLPPAEAVRTGRAIWIESAAEAGRLYPTLPASDSQHRAWAAIPLTLDGRVLGVMALSFAGEQHFREDDKAYVLLLAQKCAQAIDRARLYDAERATRTEAEKTAARLAFLVEASAALSATLNYESRLRSLVRLPLPYLADGCIVIAFEEDGSIQQTLVAAREPAQADLLRALRDHLSPREVTVLLRLFGAEKAHRYPAITDETLQSVFRQREQRRIARELGLVSMLVVSLVARGRRLGLLVLLSAESGRHYTEEDLALAQELARRAALSMDNARLLLQWREQRERLRVTLASIGDAVIATDTLGRITFMNPVAEALTGWNKDEALGLPLEQIFRIINEHNRVAAENPVTRVMREGGVVGLANHTLLIRKDNGEVPIDDSAAPIRDEDGTLLGIVLVFRDVGERREAEARSRAILKRTQDLYETSRQIGLVYTPAKVLQALLNSRYAAPMAQAALVTWPGGQPAHYEVAAVQHPDLPLPGFADGGTGFSDLLAHKEPVFIRDAGTDSRLAAPVRERCAQMGISSLLLFPLAASGVSFGLLALYYAAPYRTSADDLQHMRVFVDQIAVVMDNIRLFNAEARARREAEEANRLKMKFLAMISHELRTPLTSIKGFATTLLATDVVWDAESQHDFIATINEEADKLTDLIEQLLDLSRLQAGTLRIHPEARRMTDILAIALAQLEMLARHHQLIIAMPVDLPPVMADAQRIGQVLVNLVENAAKYSPEGTLITLSGEAEVAAVRIAVRDEGPGIPAADRERIFEPFRQAETTIAQQSKGAGLGLAICKGLIEAHGGKIWVADGAGPGTRMAFTLPLARHLA